jgi:glycosyltransferase involved in cell wall biosynthesis
MRVLIIRHGYYPSDPRVRREVRALASRGHQVDVICLRDEGQKGRESVADARVIRLPVRHRRASPARYVWEYGAFGLGAAWIAARRHARNRYHVVQVNTMPDALVFAALVPKLMHAPVLLDMHELMPELYASKFDVPLDHPLPRMLAWVERASVRFADFCLAVSTPCLDRYVSRGSPRRKFAVVMNTADPVLFQRRESRVGRAEHQPAAGRRQQVASHGTLVERYGFDVLLEAVTEVPGVRLEILGEGEARPALERLARALGLTDRVVFTGRVPLEQVAGHIGRADVGVVANRSDAFTDLVVPTKLMEYVALGIPVVVARTPAVEAYFDDQAVAFFRAGDPGDLARALAQVLGSESLRSRMVARADEVFTAKFGGDVMPLRYAQTVERLGSRARVLHDAGG